MLCCVISITQIGTNYNRNKSKGAITVQEYLQKTRLGALFDRWGTTLLMLLCSVGLFVLLWGLRPSALTAGLALFIMLLILRIKTRAGRLARREKELRRRIGGELKLEEWVIAPPNRAHFEAALLLSQAYEGMQLTRAGERGVLCEYKDETLLVAACQLHRGEALTARDVAALQRICIKKKAARALLCGVGEASRAAREQASLSPTVTFISRDKMISLAGEANPATDSQLVALGKRRRQGAKAGAWLAVMLDRRRAPRYALYGLLLLALYILTGAPYYPVPGCLCLVLSAACRVFRQNLPDSLD